MTRPRALIVVAGTATEIGKTRVACALAQELRDAGYTVAARKPAQSFAPSDEATDADLLAAATAAAAYEVCPPHRWYRVPMAPFMAADALGQPAITLADLVDEITWSAGVDVGLVEPAGGVRSPITHDGADTIDLIDALRPDHTVLVADAGLGTINAVRLCLDALAPRPTVVMLNRYDDGDDLHRRNRQWLADHAAAPVVVDIAALAARLISPTTRAAGPRG